MEPSGDSVRACAPKEYWYAGPARTSVAAAEACGGLVQRSPEESSRADPPEGPALDARSEAGYLWMTMFPPVPGTSG